VTESGPSLIDTHAHLDDDQFAGDVGDVIERAILAGVRRIINIGYRPERWQSTLELAGRYPILAYSLGLHPHHAEEWSPAVEAELIRLIHTKRPVALGEIGLDYYRNFNPPDVQQRVFARQLEIASELRLPVVIHQRHAEQDLMHLLATAPAGMVCVLHSFDGSSELADFAIDRGYFIGVGGLMTRAGSTELRNVLAQVPLDRILVETDSPYLVPAGIKNRRNEPVNVAIVANRLAELLESPTAEVAAATVRNAQYVFGPLVTECAAIDRVIEENS
jgi:TatD DNase family protein